MTLDDANVQAFLRAVGTGQLDAVRRTLAVVPALVNAVGPHPFWGGRPQPLHVAIESNRREVFDLLLESGADVDGSNAGYGHWSPLLIAANRNRAEYVIALLDHGAHVGLVEALALGDDARVDAILDHEAGGGMADPFPGDATPLHFARTAHAVERLLALGVPADRPDRWGAPATEALSRLGTEAAPLLARLAQAGVRVPAKDLARAGDRASIERLRAAGDTAWRAPATLKAAVESGHRDLVVWLLDLGADVNGRAGGPADETPLHAAAWRGDLAMVRLLVERGADVGALDREHVTTPLVWAETAVQVTNNPDCAGVAEYLRGLS